MAIGITHVYELRCEDCDFKLEVESLTDAIQEVERHVNKQTGSEGLDYYGNRSHAVRVRELMRMKDLDW